ncbi:MAG: AraC family transcriptional regulator [Spirochaetota bacterium]|nr:AraC family transcriptional regulator [Spirochaetota bacterium]
MTSESNVNNDIREPDYFSKQIHKAKRFYRISGKQKPISGVDFQVVAGGRETCSSGYLVSRKTFPHHTIEFITRGHGKLILNGKIWNLSPGTVFSYGPGIPHEIHNNTNESIEKYFINIAGEKAAYLLNGELSLTGRVLHTSTPHSLLATFEEIIQSGLDHSPWSDSLCSSLTEVLFYKIARSALTHGDPGTTAFTTFLRCKNYIGAHYIKYRTLESISEACGISPSYLCRLFQKFDHQSPYQYLIRLQMNHAADYILEKQLQIQEVAIKLGFDDPQHFSRTFKNVIGVPPVELVRQSLR